jgi:hypothetical protein
MDRDERFQQCSSFGERQACRLVGTDNPDILAAVGMGHNQTRPFLDIPTVMNRSSESE